MFGDYEPNMKYDEANKHASCWRFSMSTFHKTIWTANKIRLICICAYAGEIVIEIQYCSQFWNYCTKVFFVRSSNFPVVGIFSLMFIGRQSGQNFDIFPHMELIDHYYYYEIHCHRKMRQLMWLNFENDVNKIGVGRLEQTTRHDTVSMCRKYQTTPIQPI